MCTASWWFSPEGSYELFFNRDEQKTRRAAEPPRIFSEGNIRFLAPIDPDRGGSWIAANEFGLTVCLLNHYPPNGLHCLPQVGPLTRGQLVLDCAVAPSVASIGNILEQKSLDAFAPFYLLGLSLGGEHLLFIWDGNSLVRRSQRLEDSLTTSSYRGEEVTRERRCKYSGLVRTLAPGERPPLEEYHEQHDPAQGAYSVLMNRPDACTVSQTIVRVASSHVSVAYRSFVWTEVGARSDRVEVGLPLRPSTTLAA